jgi:hypothetical protein
MGSRNQCRVSSAVESVSRARADGEDTIPVTTITITTITATH